MILVILVVIRSGEGLTTAVRRATSVFERVCVWEADVVPCLLLRAVLFRRSLTTTTLICLKTQFKMNTVFSRKNNRVVEDGKKCIL